MTQQLLTATEIKNRLLALREQTGAANYERVGLAQALLMDRDWIMGECRGNESVALDIIEADFLNDLCAALDLTQLLLLYKTYPKEVWAQHRWNLLRLQGKYEEEHKKMKPPLPPVERLTREKYQEQVDQRLAAECQVQRVTKQLESQTTTIATLQQNVAVLQNSLQEDRRVAATIREELERVQKELSVARMEIIRLKSQVADLKAENERLRSLQEAAVTV